MSGAGAGSRAAERAAAAFAARGDAVDRVAWDPASGIATPAQAAADAGVDRVVAIGGDGTVAEVAAGLLAAERPAELAILPQGTANVLALNLGLPRALDDAIAVALDGRAVPLDCGRVNGEVFLLSVGIGLHAEMVALADRQSKQRWGVAAYGLAGWRANLSSVPVRYRIDCDDRIEELEGTMVQVMNCGAVLRREWEFAPGISPMDGILDVLVYRAATLAQYLVAAAHVLRGTPTDTPHVVHRRGTRVRVDAEQPVRLQRDGELAGTTPADIAIDPRPIPIVVPVRSAWR